MKKTKFTYTEQVHGTYPKYYFREMSNQKVDVCCVTNLYLKFQVNTSINISFINCFNFYVNCVI